jgi:hypothetical protein
LQYLHVLKLKLGNIIMNKTLDERAELAMKYWDKEKKGTRLLSRPFVNL